MLDHRLELGEIEAPVPLRIVSRHRMVRSIPQLLPFHALGRRTLQHLRCHSGCNSVPNILSIRGRLAGLCEANLTSRVIRHIIIELLRGDFPILIRTIQKRTLAKSLALTWPSPSRSNSLNATVRARTGNIEHIETSTAGCFAYATPGTSWWLTFYAGGGVHRQTPDGAQRCQKLLQHSCSLTIRDCE